MDILKDPKRNAKPWSERPTMPGRHLLIGSADETVGLVYCAEDAARIVTGVNACAAMRDPAAALKNARHWMARVASDHKDFGIVLEETRVGLAEALQALG